MGKFWREFKVLCPHCGQYHTVEIELFTMLRAVQTLGTDKTSIEKRKKKRRERKWPRRN